LIVILADYLLVLVLLMAAGTVVNGGSSIVQRVGVRTIDTEPSKLL